MKLRNVLCVLILLAPLLLWGQPTLTNSCKVGNGDLFDVNGNKGQTLQACSNAQTIALGAGSITIYNQLHGTTGSFEYVFAGSPATVSVALAGCMKGGTCDPLETYTTAANSIRAPLVSKVYDYYTVTPTGTGGTAPTLTVNTTLTLGRLRPPCSWDASGNLVCPGSVTAGTTVYTNPEYNVGTCTTAATINPANGNKQRITLTNAQTCALTFTQPPAPYTASVRLKVIQSSAGSFNGGISGCKWSAGTVPTITQSSGAKDYILIDFDGTDVGCIVTPDVR